MSTLASVIIRDLLANRPAASISGRLFFASDTKQSFRDNGATWDELPGDLYFGVNAQVGTSYTIAGSDQGKLVTFTNAAAIAVTLPQAGTGVFVSGFLFWIENRGAGTLTITPTTSTIDGAATLVLNVNQGCMVVSDGTNYFTMRGGVTSPVTLISEQTPSAVGTLTFSSIPAFYRDLKVVVRGRCDAAATFEELRLQLNGDTGSNYAHEDIILNNATSSSSGGDPVTYHLIGWLPGATAPANESSAGEVVIYNYRDTTFQKTMMSQGGVRTASGAANLFAVRSTGWWANTAAVTSVTVFLQLGNFVSGTVVSLYGLN